MARTWRTSSLRRASAPRRPGCFVFFVASRGAPLLLDMADDDDVTDDDDDDDDDDGEDDSDGEGDGDGDETEEGVAI